MAEQTTLVLNVSGIGDFVDSTPALALIRKRRPDDRVVLVVAEKALPLARGCPYVDEVVGLPTRPGRGVPRLVDVPEWVAAIRSWRSRFQIVLSLYGVSSRLGLHFTKWLLTWIGAGISVGRSAGDLPSPFTITLPEERTPRDLIASYLKLVSLVPGSSCAERDTALRPELWVPDHVFSEVDAWLDGQDGLRGLDGPWVIVSLGGDRPSRRESSVRAERWLTLLQREFRVRPVLWGTPQDPGLPQGSPLLHVDARGRWDLLHSAALIAHAGVVITTQSVAQHLVSVWDVPTIVLAGPADVEKHRPHLAKSPLRMIQRETPCAPCYHHDCPHSGEEYKRCLAAITPEAVLEAFREIVQTRQAAGHNREAHTILDSR
jgi:ADP-heptose:LPS heptosyltransferase